MANAHLRKEWLRYLILFIVALTALNVIFLMNGGPIAFPDSAGIINAGIRALDFIQLPMAETTNSSGTSSIGSVGADNVVVAGRSVYLGAVMVGLGRIFGQVGFALFTATLILYAFIRSFNLYNKTDPLVVSGWIVFAVIVTPVAFFNSVLLADQLAPVAIIAIIFLFLEDKRIWQALSFVILTFCLLAHYANLAISLVLLPALVTTALVYRMSWRKPALWAITALVIGLAGHLAFSLVIERQTGQKPMVIPTILARQVEDGPAARTLAAVCAAEPTRWHSCQFTEKLPMTEEEFLWSNDTTRGAFGTLSPDQKYLISKEEGAIVFETLRREPFQLAESALINSIHQFFLIDIRDFAKNKSTDKFMPSQNNPYVGSTDMNFVDLNPAASRLLSKFWFLCYISALAILVVAWILTTRRGGPAHLRFLLLAILGGLAASAIVNGTLVGPYPRYQTRLAILPFLGAAIWLTWAMRSRYQPADSASM